MRQDYETELFFPVKCQRFQAPEDLTAETLEKVKALQFKSYNDPAGVGTTDDIHADQEFQSIFAWFQQCVDTLHVDSGWNCDRLVVNKGWANRSDAHTGHHHDAHRHPMSYVSGIFYLTEGPPTVFLDPLFQREWSSFYLDGFPLEESRKFYHAGPGGLLIFPSWLIHASVENDSEFDRYTMAFNTFPMGDVNQGGWGQPMAKVKVDGWNDIGPLNLNNYS